MKALAPLTRNQGAPSFRPHISSERAGDQFSRPQHTAPVTQIPLSFRLLRKLAIGETSDPLEAEADRMADRVLRMADPLAPATASHSARVLARKCSCHGTGTPCKECEEAEGKDKLHRKPQTVAAPTEAPPIVHEVLRSPGRPLTPVTRAFFEPRFGVDFSRIRVHADVKAAESARLVNALAYTVGNNIVFDSSRYRPESEQAKKLLAHELAHTIQQRSVLSRQFGNVPDRPLRPHDPHPTFAPTGMCYGSAICRDLIDPCKLGKMIEEDPQGKEKRERRRQLCQKQPPDPACSADGHGAVAREATKLLHAYDPNRPAPGVKIIVDKDIPEDAVGALTITCSTFTPPISGADCITIPDKMEREAAQFNNTMDPTIGGMERGKWREQTLEILVHESEHTRFRAAFRANQFPAIANTPCATNCTVSAMNELSAMLTEFVLRMGRIRTTVGLSAEDRQKELEEWREHRILGKHQSITVSLRTVRCACNCEDADKMIREAVEFTIASWSQQDKNDLHREMHNPRWNDLDLRWPWVAPPRI